MRPALIVIAAFALVATLLGWSRWLAGRRWAATGHLLLAMVAGAAVVLTWPVATYVKTFEPLTAPLPVAALAFERTGTDRHRITVTHLPSGRMQLLEVTGGEWRVELQVLRWADWLAPLAPATAYRLQGIQTRTVADAEIVTTRRLDSPVGVEPWTAGLGSRRGRPMLAVQTATGPWLPMDDRARFELRLSATGAVAVAPRGAAESRPPVE